MKRVIAIVLFSVLISAVPTNAQTVDHSAFSVAGPSTAVQGRAGEMVSAAIQVTNNLDSATSYEVRRQALVINNDGKISLNSDSDALVDGASVAPTVVVGAQATLPIPVSITIPNNEPAGTHFVGLIVTPTYPAGDVSQNQLQILMYVVVDVVEGPPAGRLSVVTAAKHRLVFGTHLPGRTTVFNSGNVSVRANVRLSLAHSLIGSTQFVSDSAGSGGGDLIPTGHSKQFGFDQRVSRFFPALVHPVVQVQDRSSSDKQLGADDGLVALVVPPLFVSGAGPSPSGSGFGRNSFELSAASKSSS